MRLYSENSSPFSAPVRVAIYAKGLEIEIEPGARLLTATLRVSPKS